VRNGLTEARAELSVAYPPEAFSGYRPPEPLRVEVTARSFNPRRITLQPAQGLIFECHAPTRIVIALERADDGPRARDASAA
jgi:hypothetical protein